jgi:two-component system, OmpR family, sensor histidine kinase TctE
MAVPEPQPSVEQDATRPALSADDAAQGSAYSQGKPAELNSLFGEILDWMLAPLLFLWPISIAATHHVANQIADQPYDQALAGNVQSISRLVTVSDRRVVVNFPAQAQTVLETDEDDKTYFQVTGLNGQVISGDKEIPAAPVPVEIHEGAVEFRDDHIAGEEVRIAYSFLPATKAGATPVLIQVAETRKKREGLASRIISGVLLPQFAIIPLAVILVYLGLNRGLAPLRRLVDRIRGRRPADLSPIPIRGAPEEVRPLVTAFNELMARLEENLQAQQRFIADAAHQMRTPITGLKMQAELALSETDPRLMRESLYQIAESVDRTAHLMNQLLQLARAEASYEKVDAVEPVDMVALARRCTQELVPRAWDKRIDLGFEADEGSFSLIGVPLLLSEMLKNLIDNAIKYTPMDGRVTVRLRAGEEAFYLEVEDSGIGIPEDERILVFDRFYRVLGSGEDGSGLGLPIVREIAELHRAKVGIHTGQDGVGTLFRVSFPMPVAS